MALGRAWAQMRRHPWLQTVAVSSLTVALAITGLYLTLMINAGRAWRQVATGQAVVAALDQAVSPGAGRELAKAMALEPAVARVEYVGRQAALERFRQQLGGRQGLLEGLGSNPLPATVELVLAPGADPQGLLDRLATDPRVSEVVTSRPWLSRLERSRRVLGELAAALGFLLVVGVVFLCANLVRLAVHARRGELEVMDLVGASSGYMRRPFVLEALMQALAASLAASLVVWGLLALLRQPAVLPLGLDLAHLLAFPALVPPILAGLAAVAALAGGWLGVARALRPEL